MTTYSVHLVQTVSSVVTVDADNPQHAIELAYEDDDMPGSLTVGAFGSTSVDEAAEWMPVCVTDANGNEVWADTDGAA